MSTTIDQAFVTQFQDQFHVKAQQMKSRLQMYTKRKPGVVVGSSFTVDVLSSADGYTNRARHSDLQPVDIQNERRYADMNDYEWPELIDTMDKLKLLIEPGNSYQSAGIASCNRFLDRTIINAALGSARTASGTQALPASQLVGAGGTGLTLDKLRATKILLDEAEMDDSDFFAMSGEHESNKAQYGFGDLTNPSYVIVCTSAQIDDMLGTTEVKSADYNTVKALSAGAINTFMGFRFVRVPSAHLPIVGTTRSLVAYAPRALEYGVGKEPTARIDFIAHKNSWQVLAETSAGCVRAEDLGVVQIDCVE